VTGTFFGSGTLFFNVSAFIRLSEETKL